MKRWYEHGELYSEHWEELELQTLREQVGLEEPLPELRLPIAVNEVVATSGSMNPELKDPVVIQQHLEEIFPGPVRDPSLLDVIAERGREEAAARKAREELRRRTNSWDWWTSSPEEQL